MENGACNKINTSDNKALNHTRGTIICDLDGTLYPASNPITKRVRSQVFTLIACVNNIPHHMAEQLYWSLPRKYDNPYHGLATLGITQQMYKNIFTSIDVGTYIQHDPLLISLFSKISEDINIVTLAPQQYAWDILRSLGIERHVLNVYSVDDTTNYEKKDIYRRLFSQYSVLPSLVVGDSLYNDIVPARQLGANTLWITNRKSSITQTTNSIYNLKNFV